MAFLDVAQSLPVADRVACFDNDGTLWCERPRYPQLDFFLDALRGRVAGDPSIGEREEFAALIAGDQGGIAAMGLERIALALAGLFEGVTPEVFATDVRSFFARAQHAELARPLRAVVYQPMLELLEALRELEFTIAIVTGGGTEFVRAVSETLYATPPELVVGTMIEYELVADVAGVELRRTAAVSGAANEGAAKVTNIQTQLGRRPVVAAGNSVGDAKMLEWACSVPGPHLALLVDHDDAEREYAYDSRAETVSETEPLAAMAERQGWTVVSMARDWSRVFADEVTTNR